MSITPLKFTGASSYSQDLQTILSRAVAIASMPVTQLQNQQSDLLIRKQSLGSINSSLSSLEAAMQKFADMRSNGALSATSSNSNIVSVNLNGATTTATYTISDITSVAKEASETTASGFATADATVVDSSDNKLQLVYGDVKKDLDLGSTGNNLNGLRDAINSLGVGVTATVLNTGATTNPYYLSLSASKMGETVLQLRTTEDDAGANIITSNNQGANSTFKFNGLPISRPDRVVTDLASGVTFTVLQKTADDDEITLSLSASRATVATALQGLVNSYNSVNSGVNQQIGENAGLLSGNFLVRQIKTTLRDISGFHAGGTIRSLSDLGISMDKFGVMSFDSAKFYALSSGNFNAALTFLSAKDTGFGTLTTKLTQLTDPITGLIKTQQDNYDKTDARITRTISELTDRIDTMQQALAKQLEHADSILSMLQSQQNMLTASVDSVNYALYGKKS